MCRQRCMAQRCATNPTETQCCADQQVVLLIKRCVAPLSFCCCACEGVLSGRCAVVLVLVGRGGHKLSCLYHDTHINMCGAPAGQPEQVWRLPALQRWDVFGPAGPHPTNLSLCFFVDAHSHVCRVGLTTSSRRSRSCGDCDPTKPNPALTD